MLSVLQVLTVILVAMAMALALAHALDEMAKWSSVWAFELECVDIPMSFGREIQWLVVANLQQVKLNVRFTKQVEHANVAVNS